MLLQQILFLQIPLYWNFILLDFFKVKQLSSSSFIRSLDTFWSHLEYILTMKYLKLLEIDNLSIEKGFPKLENRLRKLQGTSTNQTKTNQPNKQTKKQTNKKRTKKNKRPPSPQKRKKNLKHLLVLLNKYLFLAQ